MVYYEGYTSDLTHIIVAQTIQDTNIRLGQALNILKLSHKNCSEMKISDDEEPKKGFSMYMLKSNIACSNH